MQADIESSRKQLDLKEVDYDATMAAKLSISKRVYHLEKNQVFNSAAFKKYFEENKVSQFFSNVLIVDRSVRIRRFEFFSSCFRWSLIPRDSLMNLVSLCRTG